MLLRLLLAAAVLQPSTGFDQRYGDEAAREAQRDKARPTAIRPTAPGSVQTCLRMGCVNPEAAETPKAVNCEVGPFHEGGHCEAAVARTMEEEPREASPEAYSGAAQRSLEDERRREEAAEGIAYPPRRDCC